MYIYVYIKLIEENARQKMNILLDGNVNDKLIEQTI